MHEGGLYRVRADVAAGEGGQALANRSCFFPHLQVEHPELVARQVLHRCGLGWESSVLSFHKLAR